MSRPTDPYQTADFSADGLQQIDNVCLQFEDSWRSGNMPDLEAFLDGFHGALRSALFSELLFLDIEYRTRAGQDPDRSDYETRFPDETRAIESAFKNSFEIDPGVQADVGLGNIPPLENLSLTSRFQVRQFHARGGLGVVYVARDEKLGRNVAVKFSRRRLPDSAEHSRLAREAEITGRLEHPGIVPVYATGFVEDGLPCYVMQLVDGQTLQQAIRDFHEQKQNQTGTMTFESLRFKQLLQRFISVCNTIAYAHDQQVIHRDIKPSNIMLGRFGETFLLDWGLAKSLIEETCGDRGVDNSMHEENVDRNGSPDCETVAGQPIGTPAFASPEQVTGEIQQHNIQSDVYSLGATLYCLLIGKPPIDIDDLTDLKNPRALRKVSRPREIDRSIPADLNAICMTAMSFEQSNRYPSAEALADELERYLADEPIDALQEPWATRFRRWHRKHPRIFAGLAASILVALVSMVVASLLLGEKTRQLRDASNEIVESQKSQQLTHQEALSALRKLTDKTVEDWLASDEELSPGDRAFVESLLTHYQRFAKLQDDQSDAIELKVEGFFRVGQLQQVLGRDSRARQTWSNGLDLLSPLPANASPFLRYLSADMRGRFANLTSTHGEHDLADHEITTAIETIDTLLLEFPNEPSYKVLRVNLLTKRATFQQRRGNLDRAVSGFEKARRFAEELPADSPLIRRLDLQLASNHANLGQTYYRQSRYDDAQEEYLVARDWYQRLNGKKKLGDQSQLNLARVHYGLGETHSIKREYLLALQSYEKSLVIAAKLAEAFPSIPVYTNMLAYSHFGLGNTHYRLKQTDDALKEYELALKFARICARKSPTQIKYQQTLHNILVNTGLAHLYLGKWNQAEVYYQESLQIAERQYELDKQFIRRAELAKSLSALAYVQASLKKYDEADDHYDRATELIEKHESKTEWKLSRQIRSEIYQGRAQMLMDREQFEDAIPLWNVVIELQSPRGNRSQRSLRAICLGKSDPQAAFNEVLAVRESTNLDSRTIYQLASAAAIASIRFEQESDKQRAAAVAFELLSIANDKGFFRNSANRKMLNQNSSFRTMGNQDDFDEFLASLKK